MVAIVTDSAANIPSRLAGELRIHVVPMFLRVGDEVFRDGADIAVTDFYRRLSEGGQVASTATPAFGDFLSAFEASEEDEVVCVTVAASMSGAHHQASLAAERFGGRVEVVDSQGASMAEGFVALEAARVAAEGASLTEVARRATDVSGRTDLVAMVETFEYLRRSGRVKALQAYAATMLDIKPVFRFRGGEATAVARPRTRRRALDRVEQEAVSGIGDRPAHVAAVHAVAERDAADLLDRIAARVSVVERVLTEVTPVIGAHTGPGLVGVAYFC
jgi:fatty acid kinase fatty acid binding subunit